MERAREYHFVAQMPRRTVAEVDGQDATMDRQVLLNETWPQYCARKGRDATEAADTERSKWVTESWEEYEARIVERAAYLGRYAAEQDAIANANERRKSDQAAAAARSVQRMHQADQNRVATDRAPVQHSLLLDFDDLRAERERRERADLEALEQQRRASDVTDPEREERNALRARFTAELNAILDELERRRLEAEAAAEKSRQERLRREQAAKEAEERRRKEAEDAERKRREAEEEAKRAERRRKDEERRAKAKAEREAARKKDGKAPATPATAAGGDKSMAYENASKAREAREKRMHDNLESYVTAVEADAAKVATLAGAKQLCQRVAQEMGGEGGLLFHTSVYVALTPSAVDPEATPRRADALEVVNVVYSSTNCGDHLKSGTAVVSGVSKPTIAKCLRAGEPTGVISFANGAHSGAPDGTDFARIDPKSDIASLGFGDFFAAPIIDRASDTCFGHLALDTASTMPRDPVHTIQEPAEAGIYTDEAPGLLHPRSADEDAATGGSSTVVVSLKTQKAAVRLGEALGAALMRTDAAGGAAAEENKPTKKEGVPEFDGTAVASAKDLLSFYAALCAELSAKLPATNGDVYVATLNRPDGDAATVVCHRGATVADPPATRSVSDAIGTTMASSSDEAGVAVCEEAPTWGLIKDAATMGTRSEHVSDVCAADAKAAAYATGKGPLPAPQGAAAQELLLLPLLDAAQHSTAVVGIGANRASADADALLTGDVRAAIEEFIFGDAVRGTLHALQRRAMTSAVATQALEWIVATTGKTNCYVALPAAVAANGGAALEIVAASESQAWLLHKEWSTGIVPAFVDAANAESATPDDLLKHVADVSAPEAGVHFFNDALKNVGDVKGEVLVAAITLRHSGDDADACAPIHGALVIDTVKAPSSAQDTKKGAALTAMNAADKELAKTTAFLLAEALNDIATGALASSNATRAMAVEKVVDRRHLLFLSKVWNKVTYDVERINAAQLDEVKSYNNPPAVIHTVCGATLITMGTKPALVSAWDQTRKKVTHETVKKMVAFDPTSKKVKKAFSLRAKNMTKGLTADAVFTKGSYPASCFFSWTFVVILIRKAADKLRKRAAAGTLGLGAVAGLGDDATSTAADTAGAVGSDDDDGAAAGADDAGDEPTEE